MNSLLQNCKRESDLDHTKCKQVRGTRKSVKAVKKLSFENSATSVIALNFVDNY